MFGSKVPLSGYLLCAILSVCITQPCSAQRILNIGNTLKASASGVDVAGATFLMNDAVLTEGVVFAFSAFFRTDSAVRFQIWRPSNSTNTRTYMLVSEIRVIPAVQYMREDIYVESRLTEKCTRVKAGDRLGIFIEESPGAIAYVFDPSQPKALAYTSEHHNLTYGSNDYVAFDTLTFPYDFSVSAYIDTDLSRYQDPNASFMKCPKGLLIPDYSVITLPPTTPQPPPTGAPGGIGATGPRGSGGDTGNTGPRGQTGIMGAIGSTGRSGATGPRGANGLDGSTGAQGANGNKGATGPRGHKGDQGLSGPAGPPGPPGDMDSFTFVPPVLEVNDKSTFSNPMLNLALLIWLIIVTVVLLILIIVLIVRYKRRNRDKKTDGEQFKENLKSKKHSNSFMFTTEKTPVCVSPSNDLGTEESWLSSLKEETESSYSVDTIHEYGNRKKKSGKNRNKLGSEHSVDANGDAGGHVNHGADLDVNYNHQSGAVNSIYQNLDVPKHELTNY